MIVGSPIASPVPRGIAAGGLSSAIAMAAAATGAAVQVVGRIGEDAAGDQVLLALTAVGVGHVAVLREPGRRTPAAPRRADVSPSPDGPAIGEAFQDETGLGDRAPDADADGASANPAGLSVDAADLELALRYVPDYRVIVIAADLEPEPLAAVVAAAGWSGAHLVALLAEGASTESLPGMTTALERPDRDPEGTFASMVAAYAVALDRGSEPAAAFDEAQRSGGWAAVAD